MGKLYKVTTSVAGYGKCYLCLGSEIDPQSNTGFRPTIRIVMGDHSEIVFCNETRRTITYYLEKVVLILSSEQKDLLLTLIEKWEKKKFGPNLPKGVRPTITEI
jgi:hypothetical protein